MNARDPARSPKSDAAIRSALEALRRTDRDSLPTTTAASPRDGSRRVVIWSFHDANCSRSFCQALLDSNVSSCEQRQGLRTLVAVDDEDLERANQILAAHLRRHPDCPPPAIRRAYDKTIFGTLIGLALGTLVLAGAKDGWLAGKLVASLAMVGALMGYVWDGRIGQRDTPRRFTLTECLLAVALCAVLFSIGRTLAAIAGS